MRDTVTRQFDTVVQLPGALDAHSMAKDCQGGPMDATAMLHAADVLDVVRGRRMQLQGDGTGLNIAIASSWKRCAVDYSMDPGRQHYAPTVIDTMTLAQRREQYADLIRIASAEIDWLYEYLAESGYALVLSDASGVVLYEKTDATLEDTFRAAGLMAGADWSEAREGTNGIGTCIAENRPVIVHREQHFFSCHIGLTCFGAPIRGPAGELVAVLDASTLNANTGPNLAHTMALVSLSARLIEKCLFLRHFQRGSQRSLVAGERGTANPGTTRVLASKIAFSPSSSQRLLQLASSTSRRSTLTLEDLAGEDPQMLRNARSAQRIAMSRVPVMIQGPTGSGKEMFARAVHAASDRSAQPFVALNCAAIPEALIESELFGYRSGAFTGARKEGMKGKILQSSGGTLFLDEIGDMQLTLQTRLLRVLEEQEVMPLGTEVPQKVDLRVICASHQNLRTMIARGEFREDLFYRLNGITLELPPLAVRTDKERLIREFLAAETHDGRPAAIEMDAFQQLLAYAWPGNVRELRNVIRTALAICDDGIVRLSDLPIEIRHGNGAGDSPDGVTDAMACVERERVMQSIRECDGNMSRVAERLGVSRNTLYRRCKRLGIALRNNKGFSLT
jgi:transcriptional regulator of acetoin/glycerol metabolism